MSEIKTLPPQAFDGQTFIDAYRVEWRFDGSAQCWRRIGQRTDIPVASEFQTGLLSAQLKQLIDGIPESGGHFGIIAQPLLSLVPQNPNITHKDEVKKTTLTQSGTSIIGKATEERPFTPEQFVGKLLIFKTGILTKRAFLVFTNDQESVFIEGDASEAEVGDKFEILDSAEFNPSGVLLGDILLVSDTIDITCVDGEGLPLAGGASCNVDMVQCDNIQSPPGLNFELNKDFLDSLCVIVPGCKGITGERGEQGESGVDGTGDGPSGEQGDPGENAPALGNTFTGIKIIDVDDIYDTAIVSMELDAENGKLNVVRAKVRTPETNTPATQLLSTPINRSISFKNDQSFEYNLMKPTVDPVDEVDVDILKYPQQYVKPDGQTPIFNTTVSKVKLSEIVNAVIAYYEKRLDEINDEYNQRLKEYVEGKDSSARTILADLAQQVAECEFELPIDFCLGVLPSDCGQERETAAVPFDDPLSSLIITVPEDTEGTSAGRITSSSMGEYTITGTTITVGSGVDESGGIPLLGDPDTFIQLQDNMTFLTYPNNTTTGAVQELPSEPAASTFYTATWVEGSIQKSGVNSAGEPTSGFVIGMDNVMEGVQFMITGTDGDGNQMVIQKSFPCPNATQSETGEFTDDRAILEAYNQSNLGSRSVTLEQPSDWTNVKAMLCAPVDASVATGTVKFNVNRSCAPAGSVENDRDRLIIGAISGLA
jgi:hypothetical protein